MQLAAVRVLAYYGAAGNIARCVGAVEETRGMAEEFISEPITPVAGTFDPGGMTRGEPGLPQRFVWRNTEYTLAAVLEAWKEDGSCRHGSGERYLRKHWFRIQTEQGPRMRIYFERQARSKGQSKTRWWLDTIDRDGPSTDST
jgi:phosphoribosylglycinamide formyltransferase-1